MSVWKKLGSLLCCQHKPLQLGGSAAVTDYKWQMEWVVFLTKAETEARGPRCWKRMNFEQKERSLIIPTCAQLHGRVEMKPLAVSPLAPPRVCMHLCLISLSGTIRPAS